MRNHTPHVAELVALALIASLPVLSPLARAQNPSGDTPPKAPAPSKVNKPAPAAPAALVPFPAPLITEILYAVPTGADGDANADGIRQVSGDEFIEIVNPHNKPIDLRGWTITDKRGSEKSKSGAPRSGAVRFTFPPCMLKPGQTAVVFNGYGCTWGEDVGDEKRAPAKASAKFGGAIVFTIKNLYERSSLSNSADWVLLSDPQARPVHLIRWGNVDGKVEGVLLEEAAPSAMNGSIQRAGLTGPLEPHRDSDSLRFSPGLFDNPLADGYRKPAPVRAPTLAPDGKPPADAPSKDAPAIEPSPTPDPP